MLRKKIFYYWMLRRTFVAQQDIIYLHVLMFGAKTYPMSAGIVFFENCMGCNNELDVLPIQMVGNHPVPQSH